MVSEYLAANLRDTLINAAPPGAKICRGNELTDGHLTFTRTHCCYLLWFELEPQKHHFSTHLAQLPCTLQPFCSVFITMGSEEMLVTLDRSFSMQRRKCSTVASALAGNKGANGCHGLRLCGLKALNLGYDAICCIIRYHMIQIRVHMIQKI